eukprot:symbB.v1.2.028500.t3/scaffold2988.1/size65815/2
MEAARRYGGPGSQRERRGYPRHDARGPPRPVARPLDSTMPVPPGENRPRTPGRARSMSRPRTPGRPRTPESAPPEPTRQHILRKVSTQMAPPILQEEPVRHLSDQSTTASVISRHSDFPEVEGKQKGNKVDWKLKEEYETESSQDPDGIQPGEPIEATRTSPSVAFNLEDDGSCEEMPAEEPFVSEWPAIILGVGRKDSIVYFLVVRQYKTCRAAESCESLKCVAVYRESAPCQCFPGCEVYGNCCSDFKTVCMNSKDEFQAANPQQIPTQITTVAPPKLVLPEIEPEVAPEQHEALDPEVQKPRVVTGSCATFGCGAYSSRQPCQCDAGCLTHGNCCHDFAEKCKSVSTAETPESVATHGSCASYGCGSFKKTQTCQCNEECTVFGSCCHDYAATCAKYVTCKAYGCGTYRKFYVCQCDAECEEHGNCCPDFQQHCMKEMEQIKDTNFGFGTSCAIIGCGKFLSGKPCQCNAGCHHHSNCCPDYDATCGLPSRGLGRCAVLGCIDYRENNDCQCNQDCMKYNTCCKARKGFNGDAWSEQYPDDNNHYITFDENDMIARVPHPQDETEQLKEESLRWAFGLKKGTNVQGWYPQHFVDMKF